MNRLAEMPTETSALASREIQAYKAIRGVVRQGQVFHLTEAPPGEGAIDALESYDVKSDTAVAVVTRDNADADSAVLRFQGLFDDHSYTVRFQDHRRTLVFSGRQLKRDGVRVFLPESQSAEIVYVEPLR